MAINIYILFYIYNYLMLYLLRTVIFYILLGEIELNSHQIYKPMCGPN